MLRKQMDYIVKVGILIFILQTAAFAQADHSRSASDNQTGLMTIWGETDVCILTDSHNWQRSVMLGDLILNFIASHPNLKEWCADSSSVVDDTVLIVLNETIRMAGLEYDDILVRSLLRRLYRYSAIQDYKRRHVVGVIDDGDLYIRRNRVNRLLRAERSRVAALIDDENEDRQRTNLAIEGLVSHNSVRLEPPSQSPGSGARPVECSAETGAPQSILNDSGSSNCESDSSVIEECRVGDIMYRDGNYREAIAHYQNALEANSIYSEAILYWKAWAEIRSGDTAAGAADLLSLVENEPKNHRADRVLRQAAELYMAIRPIVAARELSGRKAILVIEIFRLMPERNVSAILAEMDPSVAGALMREMSH